MLENSLPGAAETKKQVLKVLADKAAQRSTSNHLGQVYKSTGILTRIR
jgi:hypothetical protein